MTDIEDEKTRSYKLMCSNEKHSSTKESFHKPGKKLHFKHLSADCRKLLKNAESVKDVNSIEDPTYHVAVDKLA